VRSTILVLAVALAAGTTQARADFVTYNLTGTIKTTYSYSGANTLPFSPGDHITWTLLYDRSTPLQNSNEYYSGYQNSYSMKYPVITNIVDRTKGYHFLLPSMGGNLLLYGDSTLKYPSSFSAGVSYQTFDLFAPSYNANLFLLNKRPFPTLDLSNLQLNSMPLNLPKSDFSYDVQSDMQDVMSFDASVDSISRPMAGTPEPGSLTLFLLGAAGLAARGIRRRMGRVG
jgi:hypothetical protein